MTLSSNLRKHETGGESQRLRTAASFTEARVTFDVQPKALHPDEKPARATVVVQS